MTIDCAHLRTQAAGLRLDRWQAISRDGTLRGFAAVTIVPIGLCIRGVAVGVTRGRAWAILPNAPQVDRGGRVIHDGATGKKLYQQPALLEWTTTDCGWEFAEALAALIEERHPGTFATGGVPSLAGGGQ